MNIGKPPPGSINLPKITSNGTITFQSTINDGGSAFPHDSQGYRHLGMTLRDYFAAAALQGILANPNLYDTGDEEAACDSYKMADAMIKAREGK